MKFSLGIALSALVWVAVVAETDEKSALVRLYEVTDGERWTNNTGWKAQDSPICSWYGVTCAGGGSTADSGVTSIDLQNNNLVGRVARLLYEMKDLKVLNLKDNKLRSGDFEAFANSATDNAMEILNLAGNSITSLTGIGDAPSSIQELHLTANNIQGDFPVEITKLTNLKTLYLSFNKLSGSIPTEIGLMPDLEFFYLYNNDLTGTIPTEVGLLTRMKVFTVAENRLTGSLPRTVNEMVNLQTFSIHNNEEKKSKMIGTLPWFNKSPFLDQLYVDGNALTGSIPPELMRSSNVTSNLVTVGLSDNLFTGSLPTSLLKFSSLFINLGGNKIDQIDPAFCDKGAWMSGLVEEHGCDAILCPKMKWSPVGRTTATATCQSCQSAANFLGTTECDETDKPLKDWMILAMLYRDLDGTQWNRTQGWSLFDDIWAFVSNLEEYAGPEPNPCGVTPVWNGVKCNENDKVTDVMLSFNGMDGTIPTEIFALPALTNLDLSKNSIEFSTDADLAQIFNSKALRSFSIGDTDVTSLNGLKSAPITLQELYLDGLNLGTKFPTEIFSLTKLTKLHTHFMSVTGTLPTEIGLLNNLESLNLYKNGLTGAIPTEIGLLTKMTWLDMSENGFTGSIPTQINALTNIEKLNIHQLSRGLTGKLPLFNKFPKLNELSLDNNKFTGSILPEFIQGITNKDSHVTISIINNELTGTVPATLDNFSDLDIRLEQNKLTGVNSALCDSGNAKWMNGEVGKLNTCDAILCPKATHNTYGKATEGTYGECVSCPSASYVGSVMCDDTDPSPEKTILDNLFTATGGRYWHRNANWTTAGLHICDREGIVCVGNETSDRVYEIEMLDNNLKGTIPPEIFEFPEIKLLGFSDNQVDISFDKISQATKLVVLKLSNTQISSLSKIDGAASSLVELHLAGNQLTGPLPDQLYNMVNVKKLFLSNNDFTGSISDKVSKMSLLEDLELAGSKLTGHIPSELAQLQNLNRLQLDLNYLTGNLPTELDELAALQVLTLGGQRSQKKLSGPLLRFSKNPALKSLDLNGNHFSGTIPSNFLDQASTTAKLYVNLAHNGIRGTVPTSLSKFTNLFIDLSNNKIEDLFDGSGDCTSYGDWMDGSVATVGTCDAILCPKGTSSETGRQETSDGETCKPCPLGLIDAPYFGATECSPHVDGTITEKMILEKIYLVTNGTEWIDQTNWNSDKSVCSWYGIKCGDSGITEIVLDSNGLSATSDVSKLMFSLPKLQRLDIKGNNVPLDLTAIPKNAPLQVLILSATGLQSLNGVTNAKDLRRLHVTDNDIKGRFPTDLFQLKNLRSLFMSFNSFTGTFPKGIGALTNLQQLYLYGNMLSGSIHGDEVSKMTSLVEFILANNYLTGSIPSSFNNLPKLEQLSLYDQQSDTLLSGTVPSFLNSTKLWYFDVTNNDLTGSIPNDFMINSEYKGADVTIYLSNNELIGTLPKSLDSFTSLDIQIAGNKITGLPQEFCDNDLWMQGEVGGVGCDAIACPPGKFTDAGRQDSPTNPCRDCSLLIGDKRYGQTFCQDVASEKATLLALFDATKGDGWDSKNMWSSKSPLCSWEGVECGNGSKDDDTGVTSLDLEANNLVGSLPTSLWKMPFLKSLNLKDNQNLHIDLDGLSSASNLELMYFSGARVDTLYGISQAKSVRQLHLTDCGISGPLPDEIYSMGNSLEGLFIAYNSFTGSLSTSIGGLSKLESFYAYDNDFEGTIPTQVGALSSLQNLVLSENLLTGSIPTELSSLVNLQIFSAFRRFKPGKRLTGRLPSFDKNPDLDDLYLDNNDLTGSIPSNFLDASNKINLVTLSNNRLEGIVPESLVSLEELDIWLEGNMISAFPPSFCNKTDWMGGAIGTHGCAAFLCPEGTHSSFGRANGTTTCQTCTEKGAAKYFGSTTCETLEDERKILVNFYDSTGGTGWYNSNDWVSSTPYCNWHGITCENGHVTEIKLGSNNLVGTPNKQLFDLPELRVLELYSNPINFRFTNIESAAKLNELRLDSTGLKNITGIGKAPALAFLDVKFNDLTKKFNDEILDLQYLRYLNMANNQMTGNIPVDYFSGLEYLKTLRLGSNQFTGAVPSFAENTRLTTIDLSDNQFRGEIPASFLDRQTISTPISIDLSRNHIHGTIPVALERFQVLTLYLRDSKITGVPDTFCDQEKWNFGDVAKYGCDAIMCPPGTYNVFGRARDQQGCMPCLDGSRLFGSTTCESPGSAAFAALPTTTLVGMAVASCLLF